MSGLDRGPIIRTVRIKRWSSSISKLFNKCQIEQIITEDFQSVPPKLKPKAALGYLFEMAHSQDIDAGQSNAVMEFFRKRSGKLFNDFSEYPEVWPWLCENGLIKAEEIDSFTTEAQKLENTVLIGLLLNYQNELGIKNVHKARENKEKNREKYSDELNARMVARATAKGIEGLTFSITGKTSFWKSNKEIQDYLALYGAKLSSSVTKKTDYLVRIDPEDQSDKVRKANELGVMVIDQADFFDMIGGRYKDAPEITIPEWIREIPNRAFMGCTTLSKVSIPEGVTNIGEEVFDDCVCLESVFVPISVIHIGKNCFKSTAFYKKSSNWESGILYCGNALIKAKRNIRGECFLKKSTRSIADGAFQSCGSLTSVKIPAGVKSIGSAVFKNCSSLSNVIIPDSVTEIGESAFADCSSLESVIIPDGVKSIRNAAFKNCSGLSNVIVPDGVTEIGESAFSGCCSLKNISVPEGVKEIKVSAFEECSSLEAFRIPKGRIGIGFYAFYNCRNLKCVTISENVKEINKWSFCNCPSLIIHAPSGSYAEKYATENSIPFVAEG